MWTEELEACMQWLPNFLGVFALDQLPTTIIEYPSSLIANTDPAHQEGQHWVGLVFPRFGEAIFFDSYAQPLLHYRLPPIARLLRQHAWSIETSPFPVQCPPTLAELTSSDGLCGEFCVFVLYHLPLHAYKLDKLFTNAFVFNDCKYNSEKVKRFIAACMPR